MPLKNVGMQNMSTRVSIIGLLDELNLSWMRVPVNLLIKSVVRQY